MLWKNRTHVFQQKTYPTVWPLLTPKIRPSLQLSPQNGRKSVRDVAKPPCKNFTPIDEASAEKSVTIHKKEKGTVDLLSRPLRWRDNNVEMGATSNNPSNLSIYRTQMRATTAHRLNCNWLLSCPVFFVRHYRHYQIKSNQIYL